MITGFVEIGGLPKDDLDTNYAPPNAVLDFDGLLCLRLDIHQMSRIVILNWNSCDPESC